MSSEAILNLLAQQQKQIDALMERIEALEQKKSRIKLAANVMPCPHLKILALWGEVLPELPQPDPEFWTGSARAESLRLRWNETEVRCRAKGKPWMCEDDGLSYFRRLFGYVRLSPFLMGAVPARNGGRPFRCKLDWLVTPSAWHKVHEQTYHQEQAA